jgi:hypothetical protein
MATSVWGAGSGAGSDNLWSTAANWTSDTKPVAGDDVVFDATVSANCTVDEATPELLSFTMGGTASGIYSGTITPGAKIQMTGVFVIEAGCTGSIDLVTFDMDVDGDFTCDGAGEFDCGTGTITCGGDFNAADQTTWTKGSSTIMLTGTGKRIDMSAANTVHHLNFSSGTCHASIPIYMYGDLHIDGDFETSGLFKSYGGCTVTGSGTFTISTSSYFNDGADFSSWAGTIDGISSLYLREDITLPANMTFDVNAAFQQDDASVDAAIVFGSGTTTFAKVVSFNANRASRTHTIDTTSNGSVVFQGNFTIIDAVGTSAWDAGTGTMTFSGTADQVITTPAGWTDVFEDLTINKSAGDVLLAGPIYSKSFTGTSTGTGTFDPGGQVIDVTGAMSWAAAFDFAAAADTMNGSDWQVDGNFTADGQTLNATAGWDLDVTGTAVASGVGDVEYSTAGGTEITATLWTDSLNNTNWDFGGAPPAGASQLMTLLGVG